MNYLSNVLDNAPRLLTVAVTTRALFDLEEAHSLFQERGLSAYAAYQLKMEDAPLGPGVAFSVVQKLLALNEALPAESQRVEVILLSRNSADTGLRIMNSIKHHQLSIVRAAFTNGNPPGPYARPFGADLLLSSNPVSVKHALSEGVAAATVKPRAMELVPGLSKQLRIAFDGDAVVFGDESERISREQGTLAFGNHELAMARKALSGGPFKNLLTSLHKLQAALPDGPECPIRTSLVTARSAPSHERVIHTFREWGVRLDEALFLGGRHKGPFLETFGADIFFDDSQHNIDSAHQYKGVAAGHVPYGVANEVKL